MARSWLFSVGLLLLLLSFSQQTSAGVMDNVNDGLKMAGQMFGINTAADVANLVAKAFSRATTRKKPDLFSVLQQGFETQQQQQDEEQEAEDYDQAEQETEHENAQESPPPASNKRQPLKLNSVQMLTNMMRMIGFDPRKLGALALNAIVMIAQAIGSTILQATRVNSGSNNRDTGPEALFEPNEHQPRSLTPGSPIDWFLKRPGAHTQRMLGRIMDRELPEYVVDMIASKESTDGNEAACLKLLMCKSSPIIWGMQNSLKKRLASEPEEFDEQSYMNANMFFKYLPSLNEFKEHGLGCEARFAKYCPLNETLAHQNIKPKRRN